MCSAGPSSRPLPATVPAVSDPPKASAPLTKTVRSLFTKFASYFPKGPGAANENARIVTAHAQDIDGVAVRGRAGLLHRGR